MNYMEWTKDMLQNKEGQALFERKVKLLVSTHFNENDEYAIEKMIKSFGESIKFQELLALKNRCLYGKELENNLLKISMNPEDTLRKFKEVENIVISEIERQYRHFNTFLSAVKSNVSQKQEA